jgi:hypothetical protein
VIAWTHQPDKWGPSSQAWSTAKKAMWILHIAKSETSHADMTSSEIANTFNTMFRECGQIQVSNVTRDLGRSKNRGLVSQNGDRWFLTVAGTTRVEQLIAAQKSATMATAAAN